jgi:hypothetical protein
MAIKATNTKQTHGAAFPDKGEIEVLLTSSHPFMG